MFTEYDAGKLFSRMRDEKNRAESLALDSKSNAGASFQNGKAAAYSDVMGLIAYITANTASEPPAEPTAAGKRAAGSEGAGE